MKKQPKDEFQIKLERETRKRLIKHILPIIITVYGIIFWIYLLAGKISGHGILWVISSRMSISIILIFLSIALIPFLWFISKSNIKSKVYDDILKGISKSLVERMMTPKEPINVKLIKSKGNYGDFILGLQKDEKIKLYAVLSEKGNWIATYAVLKGEVKKRDFEVISKEEFSEYYQLFDK